MLEKRWKNNNNKIIFLKTKKQKTKNFVGAFLPPAGQSIELQPADLKSAGLYLEASGGIFYKSCANVKRTVW